MPLPKPHPNLVRMLGLGFACGLPLPLTAFTLQQWFAASGISVHSVSAAAMLGLPYTVKFLWSPMFDQAPPPWAAGFGRRRFWLLVVQPLLALAVAALAFTDPARAPAHTALAALAVAFLSTCQDISVDAWRIEIFPSEDQGKALAAYIWGYRGAMAVASAGVIRLAGSFGWHAPVLGIACLLACCTLITLSASEAPAPPTGPAPASLLGRIEAEFARPLLEFLRRPAALPILAAVILFRLGKVMADNTAASLYTSLHFPIAVIGDANAVPLLIGLLGGAAFGGVLVAKLGTLRGLLVAGLLQASSLALYLALLAFPVAWMLFAKIGIEYFFGSAADIAFLTYVSALCARHYTAAQYALLSALAALVFHLSGGFAGYLAETLGWHAYYLLTMLMGLPALGIIAYLRRTEIAAEPGPA